MDLHALTAPAPFWIGVGILIHRDGLSRLEAVHAMHVMAENSGHDVSAQATALMAEVAHTA